MQVPLKPTTARAKRVSEDEDAASVIIDGLAMDEYRVGNEANRDQLCPTIIIEHQSAIKCSVHQHIELYSSMHYCNLLQWYNGKRAMLTILLHLKRACQCLIDSFPHRQSGTSRAPNLVNCL